MALVHHFSECQFFHHCLKCRPLFENDIWELKIILMCIRTRKINDKDQLYCFWKQAKCILQKNKTKQNKTKQNKTKSKTVSLQVPTLNSKKQAAHIPNFSICKHNMEFSNIKLFRNLERCGQGGGRGTQYKRPYENVPPIWVAKSASWYMNDPLWNAEFGVWMGQFFKIFSNLSQNWPKFKKIWKNQTIWPKIWLSGIWMGHFFLKNWYLYGSTFKFHGSTSLPKPNLSPPGNVAGHILIPYVFFFNLCSRTWILTEFSELSAFHCLHEHGLSSGYSSTLWNKLFK